MQRLPTMLCAGQAVTDSLMEIKLRVLGVAVNLDLNHSICACLDQDKRQRQHVGAMSNLLCPLQDHLHGLVVVALDQVLEGSLRVAQLLQPSLQGVRS